MSQPSEPTQNVWESAWQNNKGMFLILLSEIAGSSMDAIVRFLQQGGNGMHTFQVCNRSENLFGSLLIPTGHLSTHGYDVHPQ